VGQELERLPQIEGSMPRLNAIPKGCPFNPRCPRVFDRCKVDRPNLMAADKSLAACWLHDPHRASPQAAADWSDGAVHA
jgi:peptide/nickel transport system ATP-binding protein